MPIHKWPVAVSYKYQFIAFNIRIPPSMVEDLSFLLAHEDNKKIALTPEDFHQISVYPLKNRVPMVSEEYESTPEEFHENLSSTLKEFNTFLLYP